MKLSRFKRWLQRLSCPLHLESGVEFTSTGYLAQCIFITTLQIISLRFNYIFPHARFFFVDLSTSSPPDKTNRWLGFVVCDFVSRSDEISHSQRSEQSVDAGLVFRQRTRGTLPQHHCAQCLRENLPKWMGLVQYPVRSLCVCVCVHVELYSYLTTGIVAICSTFYESLFLFLLRTKCESCDTSHSNDPRPVVT